MSLFVRSLLILAILVSPVLGKDRQDVAQDNVRRRIKGVRTTLRPKIDGRLDDALWKTAPKAEGFQDRLQGSLVSERTTAYIAYDDESIYVAFRCLDSEPNRIVGRETVRDSRFANRAETTEDHVDVAFDTFRSYRSEDQARFSVNPIGTISARLGGGRAGKIEWTGDWEAVVKRTPDGWTAEMRIPWAILSYPPGRAPFDIGINFSRFQYRTQTESIWSNIGPNRFNELQGIWEDVQTPDIKFKPKLSLLPYVLNRTTPNHFGVQTGLDARLALSPEVTAVATLNPDFATVEGAIEGINFSRQERFVPERRPFFLEGRDYLELENFGIGRYFLSNRLARVDAGAKVYGKFGRDDTIGLLHTVDIGRQANTVMRLRHDFSETSQAGVFLSNRTAVGDDNSVAIAYQRARAGKISLSSQLGRSAGQNASGNVGYAALNYEDKLNFWSLSYNEVSPGFRNANGLTNFTNYRGFRTFNSWFAQWRNGPWRSFNFSLFGQYDWRYGGAPFRRGAGTEINLETRSDWRFGLEYDYRHFDDQLDRTVALTIRAGQTNRFKRWGLRVENGIQGNRPSTFITPSFSVRTLRKLDVSYGGAILNLDGSTKQHIVTFNYELSPTRAFGGRLVAQNADTNWYLSFRNSAKAGTETYLLLGDPNARRFVTQLGFKMVFAY